MHLAAQCPHEDDNESFAPEEKSEAWLITNVTLITSYDSELLAKIIEFGILDSACMNTAAGQPWIEEYLQTISEEEVKEVKKNKKPIGTIFHYGDGVETGSTFLCVLDAKL